MATPKRGMRAVGLDRRATDRFAVNSGAACTFASPVVEDFGAVRIMNVSMDGVGLWVTRVVESGSLLAIALANPAKGIAKTALVRVTHVVSEPGGYYVGGTFLTPLTYQEMTALVM
jgi:hypothetical protein